MDNATIWNIIDKYFQDNPQALVRHHIDSFNDFYKNGIYQIFREKNPIVLYSKLDPNTNEYMSQCKMYMGGKDGSKIYFGKVDWSRSFAKARELELSNNRTASQLSSKLQCFQWIKIFNVIQKQKKLDEFLSVLYYGAKKQYATAGPFLKIDEG